MLQIPAGKTIKIYKNQVELSPDIPLILDQDLNLRLSSTFESLVSDGSSVALNVISNLSSDLVKTSFTGQFKEFGMQVWKKTEPLSFTVQGTMRMDATGGANLITAVKDIINICLPTDDGALKTLTAPGPSLLSGLFPGYTSTSFNSYAIRVGNFFLDPIIIEKVEPVFSLETDTTGYPIYVQLSIDIKSVYTATTGMIDNMFRNA